MIFVTKRATKHCVHQKLQKRFPQIRTEQFTISHFLFGMSLLIVLMCDVMAINDINDKCSDFWAFFTVFDIFIKKSPSPFQISDTA
jgi:hypothetical protein